MFNLFNRKKLYFLREYKHYGAYSESNRVRKTTYEKILKRFKKTHTHSKDQHLHVKSKFNGIYYPVFDLDSEENLKLFKELFDNEGYAIFRSSEDHYWGFLDKPCKNINQVHHMTEWHNCNDPQFVEYSMSRKTLHIRGLYETENRKPILCEIYGNVSKNFNEFINKLNSYYKNEALELSVLRYKDEQLLKKFSRIKKLEKINIEQNNGK